MAISLKNHDDRIANLETKIGAGGGIVESNWSSGGWYIKFAHGLLIQGGTNTFNSSYVTFPKAFKNTEYTVIVSKINNDPHVCVTASELSTSRCRLYNKWSGNESTQNTTYTWIAIGYLISYRILNYAYAYIKSLRDFKAVIKSHSFCNLLSKISREVI